MSKIYAVIVAGGSGSRMGTAIPKQFLDLGGKAVLCHTIQAFLDAVPDIHIHLVLPSHQFSYAQMVLQGFPDRIDLTILAGGATRFHSVQNGLKEIPEDAIVLVHDGVRPLVDPGLIRRCIDQATEKGSAVPAIAVSDSVRQVRGEGSTPVDRSSLRLVQTPQTFRASILLPAFRQPYQEAFTDEATVVEAFGNAAYLIEGQKSNIKITTPEDMLVAEAMIRAKETI